MLAGRGHGSMRHESFLHISRLGLWVGCCRRGIGDAGGSAVSLNTFVHTRNVLLDTDPKSHRYFTIKPLRSCTHACGGSSRVHA